MGIRNNHWYNLNELRSYPLDDIATCLSNAGDRLPANLIEDLRLRWPLSLGQFAFISAATVTRNIVTVLIEVSSSMSNDPGSSVLVAGISIPISELLRSRTYTLQSFVPGVAGYIAIGSGSEVLFTGVFSSPTQSLLTPRAARFYRLPPITGIRVEGTAARLTGIVNLTAAAPLSIEKATRVINGVEYDNVIVLKLSQSTSGLDIASPVASVFSQFVGPCGGRINSNSCPDPQPISAINGVTPDCDGVLILNFQGCSVVGRMTPDCGVVVDCNIGLSATCRPLYLPALTDGKLPSEVPSTNIPVPPDPEEPDFPDVSISEVFTTVLAFPYCDTFDTGTAEGFVAVGDSLFGFIADDSPAEDDCCSGPPYADDHECCTQGYSQSGSYYSQSEAPENVFDVDSSYGTVNDIAQSRNNISLFSADIQTLYRKYTTDVKIMAGMLGSRKNAGVLANYRVNPDNNLPEFWVAFLNIDTSLFGLYFFNGVSYTLLGAAAEILSIKTGDWYRITLTVVPDPIIVTRVNLTARLQGIYEPAIDVLISSSATANAYLPDTGVAGFLADRSRTIFSFWRIDEVAP